MYNVGVAATDRFFTKIYQQDNGCWIWLAAKFKNGYGAFSYNGKTGYAHRFAYEFFVEPIPHGFDVHHTCSTPACVNPEHMELMPHGEHRRFHGLMSFREKFYKELQDA